MPLPSVFPIVQRRPTIFEEVNAARSRYDQVECPSLMPACFQDPTVCVFCNHRWDNHGEHGCGSFTYQHGGRSMKCRCHYRLVDGVATSVIVINFSLPELPRLPPVELPIPRIPSPFDP